MDSSSWRFSHIGIIVRNTDESLRFFQTLGFDLLKGPYDTTGRAEGAPRSRIAHIQRDGASIELVQPIEGTSVNTDFLNTIGEGVNHICYEVDDLETERLKMAADGFTELYGSEIFAYFDTRAKGNLIIELKQRR